jgi:hypothetical protein
MSDIKLQSLIRKLRNEKFKEGEIKSFTYKFEDIDINIDNTYLYQSKFAENFEYSLDSLDIFDTLGASGVSSETPDTENDKRNINYQVLNNVYNMENCDINWLTFMYTFNNIYSHYHIKNNINIKSLHICNSGEISAMERLFYNSNKGLVNVDWNWLYTSDSNVRLDKKYKRNMLKLLTPKIYDINNINYIINDVNKKVSKVNLIVSTVEDFNTKLFITYAIYSIKLLEVKSLLYIRIPNINEWNTQFINCLLLFANIFTEMYVYTFDLEKQVTVLICKDKKKLNNEILYKKLIHILQNENYTNGNIFSKDLFDTPEISEWLNSIININSNNTITNSIIGYDDIIHDLNSFL